MEDAAALALRLVFGGIFCASGFPKLFHPPDATYSRARLAATLRSRGFPAPAQLALLVGLSEFICGSLVLLGLFARPASLPLLVVAAMATFVFRWKAGFHGGWDWPLSVLGGTVGVFLLGPGNYSLDALFGFPLLV